MNIGTDTVAAAKVGSTNVSKVYKGDTQIWTPDEPWTLVMIPDTQHLTSASDNLDNLFQYVVDEAETRNIQFMWQVGDLVAGLPASDDPQWTKADAALDIWKNSGIAHHINIGNHDYDNSSYLTNRESTNFKNLMGLSWYQQQSWFIDDTYDGMTNKASKVTIGSYTYLFISTEHLPRTAAITWTTDLIDAHYADVDYIILSIHAFLLADETRSTNQAVVDYYAAVKDYSKVKLIFGGHVYSGDGTPAHGQLNEDGIQQECLNYQNESGSNYSDSAVIRFYEIDPSDNHSVSVTTYNPLTDTSYTDSDHQYTFSF